MTMSESGLRRAFARYNYVIRKSRRSISLENAGEFMLVDASTNFSVIGHRYDAGVEELTEYLNDIRAA